jgi:hypothetical protein
MTPTAKWTRVDGRPFVQITLPGGFRVRIPQYTAWQLKNALERVLATAPPRPPDNDHRGN